MRRILYLAVPAFIIFVMLLAKPAFAETSMFMNIGLETRHMTGEMTYDFNFINPFALGGNGSSRLEFDMDNYFYGVDMQIGSVKEYDPNRRVHIFGFTWLSAISGDAGTMKDSDWIENDLAICGALCVANTPGRDLYSTSDDDLDNGKYFDIYYRYNYWVRDKIAIAPIVGYGYSKFRHEIVGCQGTYWGNPITCLNKPVIELDLENEFVYFGVGTDIIFGKEDKGLLQLSVRYSPWATTDYKDTHFWPDVDAAGPDNWDMETHGDHDGDLVLIKMSGSWRFNPHWMATLGGEYMNIYADGQMRQRLMQNDVLVGITRTTDSDSETTTWSSILRLSYLYY